MAGLTLPLSALFLLALGLFNRKLGGHWSYPPAVFSLTWAALVCGLRMAGDFFVPVSAATTVAFVTGALAFSIGGLITVAYANQLGGQDSGRAAAHVSSPGMGRLLDGGIILLILTLPFFYQRLVSLSRAIDISDFWIAVRAQIAFGTEQDPSMTLGVFARIMAFATFLAFVATAEVDRTFASKRRAVLLILVAVGLHTATMARLGALVTLFGAAGIYLLKFGQLPVKAMVVTVLSVVTVFAVPAILLGKGGNRQSGFDENISGVTGSIALYVLGGSVALDQAYSNGVRSPLHMPRIIQAPAESLGIAAPQPPPPPFEPYINIPMPINVYTIYYQYFTSYGLAGVALAMLLIGAVCAWVYAAALHGSPPAMALFGVVFANILVSNAADGFLNGLSYDLQAVAAVLILYWCAARLDGHLRNRAARWEDDVSGAEALPGV